MYKNTPPRMSNHHKNEDVLCGLTLKKSIQVATGVLFVVVVLLLNFESSWKAPPRKLKDAHHDNINNGANNRWQNPDNHQPYGDDDEEPDMVEVRRPEPPRPMYANSKSTKFVSQTVDLATGHFEYVADADAGCALGHTLSKKQPLKCDCDNDCSRTLSNGTAGNPDICGGIPLTPGFCLRPKSGVFKQTRAVLEYEKMPKPETLCAKEEDVNTESAHFEKTGIENPQSAYTTKDCTLIPYTNIAASLLASAVGTKQTRILLMGDSHVRNLFSGIQAAFRNMEYVVEGHSSFALKEEGVLGAYHVWFDQPSGLIKDDYEYQITNKSYEHGIGLAKSFCDGKPKCISFVFLWGPTFREAIEQWPNILQFDPHMLISAINSYEQHDALSSQLEKKYMDYFKSTSSLRQWIWQYWPYGMRTKGLLEKRVEKIQSMITIFESLQPNVKRSGNIASIGHLHEKSCNAPLTNNENCNQTSQHWHSICGIYDTYPSEQHTINAREMCTALLDKTFVRLFFTHFLHTLSL